MNSQQNTKFQFEGIDHVTFTCSDMERTTDFYHRKLGMPILYTIEYENDDGEKVGQHFFFGVGDGDAHIAMFFWKDGYQTLPVQDVTQRATPPNPLANPIASFGHLNLRVPDHLIGEYCDRLAAADINYFHMVRYRHPERPGVMTIVRSENSYTPPQDGALMSSVYFRDPDGILLEFNSWFADWKSWPNDAVPWTEPNPAA